MLRPDFCTTVSPNEYDCVGQFEQAVKEANKFHKRMHEECPPPYFTFDYGKLYGLVKFYAETKAAEQGVQSDECEACRDKSYITLGNGNVICWYCGRIRR